MTTLSPGPYLIELEFTRSVDVPTLMAALGKMGFIQLTPDDTASSIGALPASALTRPASSSSRTVVKVSSPAVPRAAASALMKPAKPSPVARPNAQVALRPVNTPVGPSPLQRARAPVALKPLIPVAHIPVSPIIAVKPPTNKVVKLPTGQLPTGQLPKLPKPALTQSAPPKASVVTTLPLPASLPSTTPTASAAAAAAPAGGGGGGGGHSTEDPSLPPDEVPVDEPLETSAPEPSNVSQATIAELWRRWREWGSPFAEAPSAETSGDGTFCFRFIGRLVNPLRITNRPGMRWLYVRKLSLNPFGDLDFNLRPMPLRRGGTYELRFLSRVKAMPTREDVKQGLVDMGFAPMKLSLMQKNMRVPNRAGSSVAMWYGIATWERASTTSTVSDPFFFLDANEVHP